MLSRHDAAVSICQPPLLDKCKVRRLPDSNRQCPWPFGTGKAVRACVLACGDAPVVRDLALTLALGLLLSVTTLAARLVTATGKQAQLGVSSGRQGTAKQTKITSRVMAGSMLEAGTCGCCLSLQLGTRDHCGESRRCCLSSSHCCLVTHSSNPASWSCSSSTSKSVALKRSRAAMLRASVASMSPASSPYFARLTNVCNTKKVCDHWQVHHYQRVAGQVGVHSWWLCSSSGCAAEDTKSTAPCCGPAPEGCN